MFRIACVTLFLTEFVCSPCSGQGVRGGRATERKEANVDDLDKDLEAYLKVSRSPSAVDADPY